jgi:tRNA(fMet)-specific endonuclease VapC
MISVVSIGEIKSLAIRNKWGEKRLSAVEKMFERFIVVNIVYRPLIDMYAEIDNFSQGTLSDNPLVCLPETWEKMTSGLPLPQP